MLIGQLVLSRFAGRVSTYGRRVSTIGMLVSTVGVASGFHGRGVVHVCGERGDTRGHRWMTNHNIPTLGG